MFARLALLFITIPLVEMYLLFRLYDATKATLAYRDPDSSGSGAALVTVAIVLFTGFLGAWLAKQQGLSTIQKIQKSAGQGKLPAAELVDGGMILFAAALLLTPGILTDAFGFSLLIPPCRRFYRSLLKKHFPANVVQFKQSTGPFGQPNPYDGENEENVVDGTSRTVDGHDPSSSDQRQDPSRWIE